MAGGEIAIFAHCGAPSHRRRKAVVFEGTAEPTRVSYQEYQQTFPELADEARLCAWRMIRSCRMVVVGSRSARAEAMSHSPDEAAEEGLDLERLVIDADYRQEVMLRLKTESLGRRAARAAQPANKAPLNRKD